MALVTVASLASEVYALTARPDLTQETPLALRRAFMLLHRKAKFWKDLRTEWVAAGTPADPRSLATQVIDLSTISNLRQVHMVRADGYSELDPVDVNNQLDTDQLLRPDVWWAVGSELQLRSNVMPAAWELHYYVTPAWNGTDIDDWLVDEHRDLLVIRAAGNLLRLIGDAELADSYEREAGPLMVDLLQDNIEAFAR